MPETLLQFGTFDTLYGILGNLGMFVFAISGGIVAVRREMDLFGVIFVAFLPAIGGGTIRDICLDVPIFWLENQTALWISLAGGLSAYFFYRFWTKLRPLVWADAIGLSVFAPLGAAKAIQLGHGGFVAVLMGVLTAIAGGLLRDLVCNEESLLMREDIYATAAIIGSLTLWGCMRADIALNPALIIATGVTFAIRALSIRFKVSLPKRTPF